MATIRRESIAPFNWLGSRLGNENRFTGGVDFRNIGLMQTNNIELLNYYNRISSSFNSYKRMYSIDDINRFLENPVSYSRDLVKISRYLNTSSSYYMRLIHYMGDMLTLDNIVTPNDLEIMEISTDAEKMKDFAKEYIGAITYIDDYSIKHEFSKILTIMLVEDVFYGYERVRKEGKKIKTTVQVLPHEYCDLIGKKDGNYIFAFDMSMFSGNVELLKLYPKEFKDMYAKYIKTNNNWQLVNPDKGVCFKFREDVDHIQPPFSAVFPDIYDLQETKDLIKTKNKLDSFMLAIQKIPFKKDPRSEDDFLIAPDSVKVFHDNIRAISPKEVGVVSTPMDVQTVSFAQKDNTIQNNAKQAKEEIFDSAGTPSSVFIANANKNAVALIKAIQNDESMMFRVLRQFERFFKNRLETKFKKYSFTISLPNVTVYNREDYAKELLSGAQSSLPTKILSSVVTSGMSTTQVMGMAIVENEIFKINDLFVPLQSSFTTSNKDNKDSGGQEKSSNKLSDKGAETRVNGTNTERDLVK